MKQLEMNATYAILPSRFRSTS